MQKTYYIFNTEMGWGGIAGVEGKISDLQLPSPTREEAVSAIRAGTGDQAVESLHDSSGQAERIADFFAGRRVDFTCDLELSDQTDFQRRVWAKAREIPYGETRTYGWIADQIGCPAGHRAVGQAMGANPVPIIVPCHRVVRSDGGLGGFSCGLHWKVRLLEMERRVGDGVMESQHSSTPILHSPFPRMVDS
jgi:O-6-methylguanine DNA methyltransferase